MSHKFHDPDVHLETTIVADNLMTVEIGREGWRQGITISCITDKPTVHVLRATLNLAFEHAGGRSFSPMDMTAPGWWAIHVATAMMEIGPTRVQRIHQRARRHGVMLVADADLSVAQADWPLVRLAPTMPWLDLRGEAALRHGPTDTELAMYREASGIGPETTDGDLRYAFEHGILEWIPGEAVGRRRGIRAAGS